MHPSVHPYRVDGVVDKNDAMTGTRVEASSA